MGFLMQMVSLIAQNSVELRDMGVASSARMFFQQMGGSLGVAAFGAVFARRLNSAMASAGGQFHVSGGALDPATVTSLPAASGTRCTSRSRTRSRVCSSGSAPSVLIFVLALFIKEVPLRGRRAGQRRSPPPSRNSSADAGQGWLTSARAH